MAFAGTAAQRVRLPARTTLPRVLRLTVMATLARPDRRKVTSVPSAGRPWRAPVREPPRGTGANDRGLTFRDVSRMREAPATAGGLTVNVRSAPTLVPSGPVATSR